MRWRRLGLMLMWIVGLLLLGGRPATAQQPPPDPLPDPRTYEIWIREALIAAQRGDLLGLESAADRLTAADAVQLADGTTVPVDNAWLAQAMDTPTPDTVEITARLQAILDTLARPRAAAPADAQQQLAELLSRPPFAEPERPDLDLSWLEQLLRPLLEWLEPLFRPATEVGQAASPLFNVIVTGVSLLLLLVVLVVLVRSLRRSTVSVARTAPDPDDPDARLTPAEAVSHAQSLAHAGDFRTAMRYMYLALLLRLDAANLLRYDRALTNYEYLEQLRDNPQLRTQITPIIQTFDRVWYGNEPLDAAGFQAYAQQVAALPSEGGRG